MQVPIARRQWERVCGEGEEAREETREVLEYVRWAASLDVGRVEQAPGGAEVEEVFDDAVGGCDI